MVQQKHLHPPCWNCVDRDFSRDWNQLSFPEHQTKPTEHLDFTFSLHFPREQRSYVCSCKEKIGVKSKIKGERGDLDLNNISQPRIL